MRPWYYFDFVRALLSAVFQADQSRVAQPGIGGGVTEGGTPGDSSSWQIVRLDSTNVWASPKSPPSTNPFPGASSTPVTGIDDVPVLDSTQIRQELMHDLSVNASRVRGRMFMSGLWYAPPLPWGLLDRSVGARVRS